MSIQSEQALESFSSGQDARSTRMSFPRTPQGMNRNLMHARLAARYCSRNAPSAATSGMHCFRTASTATPRRRLKDVRARPSTATGNSRASYGRCSRTHQQFVLNDGLARHAESFLRYRCKHQIGRLPRLVDPAHAGAGACPPTRQVVPQCLFMGGI